VLFLFDPAEAAFVRGFSGFGLYAVTIHRDRRPVAPGASVSFRVELALCSTMAEAARAGGTHGRYPPGREAHGGGT